MARPKNKAELLEQSQTSYAKLNDYIKNLSPSQQTKEFPAGTMNRNIRDVLAHVHHWHLLFLDWYTVGMAGEKPNMPAAGYTWKTTSELNRDIWQRYQETSLEDAKQQLQASFQKLRPIIEAHNDEELFTKKYYPWTGSTSLGSYLISATSSHYAWALKLVKKQTK